jgi:DNA-binding response OmpR family regulator
MKLLFIDDHGNIAEMLSLLASKKGHESKSANNPKDGLKLINDFYPDVVVSDIRMPSMSGLDLCKKSRENGYRNRFYFLTAFEQKQSDVESCGANGLFEKGIEGAGIIDTITK